MKMRFFKPEEFNCACGQCGLGVKDMSTEFLYRLDHAREIADVSFVIHPDRGGSAVRCAAHNADPSVGGSPTSSHVPKPDQPACAVDIYTPSSYERMRILYGLVRAGFTRIGIAKTFIHADCDPTKPAEVCWVY